MNRQRATGIALRHPIGKLAATEQIARVGKGRLPAAIVLPRIPADVIDMQMGAEHQVDFGRIDAGLPQPIEKTTRAPLMPGWNFGNVLVIADATVDQQGFSARSKDEALDGEPGQISGAIEKVGLQCAAVRLKQFRIGSRQELRQWKSKIVIVDDDIDGRVTD